MQFIESIDTGLLLTGLIAYLVLFFVLLYVYFKGSQGEEQSNEKVVERSATPMDVAPSYSIEATPIYPQEDRQSSSGKGSGIPQSLRQEMEHLFLKEKDPVWVVDEDYRVCWGNRSALHDFAVRENELKEGLPLGEILGLPPESWNFSEREPTASTVEKDGLLPNGERVRMGMRISLLNRSPKVYAVRVFRFVPLEKENAGLAVRPSSTELTRGRTLDYREVDPDSVELSADQMLEPLKEIDHILTNVGPGETLENGVVLRSARAKVRRMIHQIEEMDWMLQVNAGQLHLNKETFNALTVLKNLVHAANRLTGESVQPAELNFGGTTEEKETYHGDRRIFEKILTQLITSAFRSGSGNAIRIQYNSTPVESPVHSDDWHLFVGEEVGDEYSISREAILEIIIDFGVASEEGKSDLPTVVETLGSQILDPRTVRRLDFVKKGRDSDLFGLTLARELVTQLKGELFYETPEPNCSRFRLQLNLERGK